MESIDKVTLDGIADELQQAEAKRVSARARAEARLADIKEEAKTLKALLGRKPRTAKAPKEKKTRKTKPQGVEAGEQA